MWHDCVKIVAGLRKIVGVFGGRWEDCGRIVEGLCKYWCEKFGRIGGGS